MWTFPVAIYLQYVLELGVDQDVDRLQKCLNKVNAQSNAFSLNQIQMVARLEKIGCLVEAEKRIAADDVLISR